MIMSIVPRKQPTDHPQSQPAQSTTVFLSPEKAHAVVSLLRELYAKGQAQQQQVAREEVRA